MGILMCILKKIVELSKEYVDLFVCLGVVVAGWQWFIMRKGKKQATIEFYNNIRKDFIDSLKKLDERFPKGQDINPDDIKGLNNLDIKYAITEYLSCMERFAVGLQTNIYDIKVFKEMVGATLTVEWYKKLEKVICFLREEYKSPKAYKNLEDLVSKLS
ncbi:MAG: DUF4760 domain-containing protein [Spirochaetes bacterium]|nr:DUF4760 domain-containing protein [Brevinematales bacterium]MCL1959494.1 DUF4760 domain-containing protein [Spirochaetota bacterium]